MIMRMKHRTIGPLCCTNRWLPPCLITPIPRPHLLPHFPSLSSSPSSFRSPCLSRIVRVCQMLFRPFPSLSCRCLRLARGGLLRFMRRSAIVIGLRLRPSRLIIVAPSAVAMTLRLSESPTYSGVGWAMCCPRHFQSLPWNHTLPMAGVRIGNLLMGACQNARKGSRYGILLISCASLTSCYRRPFTFTSV